MVFAWTESGFCSLHGNGNIQLCHERGKKELIVMATASMTAVELLMNGVATAVVAYSVVKTGKKIRVKL